MAKLNNRLVAAQPVLIAAALITLAAASPAHAGWMQDAIGAFITETLTDSKTLGVTIAAIGFIWGVIAYIFGWGTLKIPAIAIVVGAVIGLADTFIGAAG